MPAPDPATLRAVEAAALNRCSGLVYPECKAACRLCTERMGLSVATFLDAMGQDIAAARVRRCVDQPAPDADAAFLTAILQRARDGGRATADEVARLKALAGWADAPPAPGWDGSMDVREVEHAVEDAMGRMGL
jgi:hypothetical protein